MSFPTVTPVLSVAGTFSANDYVGTSGTAMVFSPCGEGRSANGGGARGYVVGARMIDFALKSISTELWVFDTAVTPPADNAAWSISDADSAHLICVIPFSTYYASALNSVSAGEPEGGPARYITADTNTNLYGCLVTRGAPVYTTGDLTVRLSIIPD